MKKEKIKIIKLYSIDTNQNLNNKKVKEQAQILEFRFKAPSDWLGLAGSKVKIDRTSSKMVDVILFRDSTYRYVTTFGQKYFCCSGLPGEHYQS